jgi:hypothetical protein
MRRKFLAVCFLKKPSQEWGFANIEFTVDNSLCATSEAIAKLKSEAPGLLNVGSVVIINIIPLEEVADTKG